MEFPNQQSNKVNLYRELRKDEKMIDACVPLVKAKFREAVSDKGRCCWETLSVHELLKMLQDHQHKFFLRGMNNQRDAADLVGISMMILSKCEQGEFKYLNGIPFPQMPQPMPCPYGSDNASEKFDEECDALLRKLYRGEEPIICDRIFSPEEIEEFTESYGQCGEIKLLEDPELSFASNLDQKILDRTKIRTARKRDKSGEFMIGEERFIAEFEIAMTMPAFVSLFDNGFFTPEQFGFDSSVEMWRYYAVYFNHGGLVFVHKIISIGVDIAMGVER
jgi:hypothetical protein